MSSTISGSVSVSVALLGSVAALGGTAIAATCIASGAAIGGTIGLPLYAAYKSGKFVIQQSREIVDSRYSQQESEEKAIKKELSIRFELKRKAETLEQLACDDDILNLLSSLKLFLENTDSPSIILHSVNENCESLINEISQEIEERKKSTDSKYRQTQKLQHLKNLFYKNIEMKEIRLTYASTAQQPIRSRSEILEDALNEFFQNEKNKQLHSFYSLYTELQTYIYGQDTVQPISAFSDLSKLQAEIKTLSGLTETKIKNIKLYASLVEQARKNTQYSNKAEETAQKIYIQLAFQTELKNLNIISNDISTSVNVDLHYYTSGSQTLKQTILPGGYSTLELLTPSPLIQQAKPAMLAQQKVKCQEMAKLSLLLKSKWGVNFNPGIINNNDILISEETASATHSHKTSYFQTAHTRRMSEKNVSYHNPDLIFENCKEEI